MCQQEKQVAHIGDAVAVNVALIGAEEGQQVKQVEHIYKAIAG